MTDRTHARSVDQAERAIVDVLKKLEAQLGLEVTGLDIRRIDVTNVSDAGRRFLKLVSIEVAPDEITTWG